MRKPSRPSVAAWRLPALVHGLETQPPSTRAGVAVALHHRWRAGEAVEAALTPVLAHGDVDARRRTAELFAAAARVSDTGALVQALADSDGLVRALAAQGLGRHGVHTPRALLALLAAASDPDPRVRIAALAALAVVAPSEAVVRRLGRALVADRFSVAGTALAMLESAPGERTLQAAAPLLHARDPLERRAGLAVVHASGAPVDKLYPALARLCPAGSDAFVRRAAVRALGRLEAPPREAIELLTSLGRDWDPSLRLAAAVALGQLAARDRRVEPRYTAAMRRVSADEAHDLAAALRAAARPAPPHAPLLARLAMAHGYALLDLADAIISPLRGRELVPGVVEGGVALPVSAARADDALDEVPEAKRARIATRFHELTAHAEPAVRACGAVFAAHLDHGLATAIVLQRLAASDADVGVRAVARALLERLHEGAP
jgi:hypothetical protein